MFMYNPIGKTLAQVHKDCGSINLLHNIRVKEYKGEY